MPRIVAYLAGPDVFLPHASANAAAKIAICDRHGIIGRAPLDDVSLRALPPAQAWRVIYRQNLEMMAACDIIIANLTPFRGPSADAGTLVELGWFAGRGRPVFGYSNTALGFAARSAAHLAVNPDPLENLQLEGFELEDNLMIPGAAEFGGGLPIARPADGVCRAFDALDVFEACVAAAAQKLAGFTLGPDASNHSLP